MLRLSATAGKNIKGTSKNDKLSGTVLDDVIEGKSGADTLNGGDGLDTLSYVSSTAGVSVNLSSGRAVGGHAAGDRFSNFENITGSRFADRLTGNGLGNALSGGAGNDRLYGLEGNDALTGGSGNDLLYGGGGEDSAVFAQAFTEYAITRNADGSWTVAHAREGTDKLFSIEQLRFKDGTLALLAGSNGDDRLDGAQGRDWLDGGAGDDYLNGGAGADVLSGGAGNDVYVVDNASDVLREDAGAGHDTVTSRVDWTLGGNFEDLCLEGIADLRGTGNGLANHIDGNIGNNMLDGRGGDDVINGKEGNDTLLGGDGADELNGGTGDDTLTGGSGADRFVFESRGGSDVITDFTIGSDLIDLCDFRFTNFATDPLTITATGDDILITVGEGDEQITITLKGLASRIGELSAADFLI